MAAGGMATDGWVHSSETRKLMYGAWVSIPLLPIIGLRNTFLWIRSSLCIPYPGQICCPSFLINNLEIGLKPVDTEMPSGFNQDIYESYDRVRRIFIPVPYLNQYRLILNSQPVM